METGDHGKCVLKPVGKLNLKESNHGLIRQFANRVQTKAQIPTVTIWN
jgi:hypothetical protein